MLMILGLFSALMAGAAADTMLSLRERQDDAETDESTLRDDDDPAPEQSLMTFSSGMDDSLPDYSGQSIAATDNLLTTDWSMADEFVEHETAPDRIHSSDSFALPPAPEPIVASLTDTGALRGGALDDVLIGGTGGSLLAGHGGNDWLTATSGPAHQIGGEGHDVLVGGDGDDRLEGCDGDDLLVAGLGSNTLLGGDGEDTLIGIALDADGQDQGGQNFLNGGAGNDVLLAGSGDYLNGGGGSDQFTLGTWLQAATTIVDYQDGEDQIILNYDPARITETDLSVTFAPEDPTLAQIWLNGQMIAQVANAPGLSAGDIALVAQPNPGLAGG